MVREKDERGLFMFFSKLSSETKKDSQYIETMAIAFDILCKMPNIIEAELYPLSVLILTNGCPTDSALKSIERVLDFRMRQELKEYITL